TPINRIGLHYTPTCALFQIGSDKMRPIVRTNYVPFVPASMQLQYDCTVYAKLVEYETKYFEWGQRKTTLEFDNELDAAIFTSCQRYHEYVTNENNMDSKLLFPLEDSVIQRILDKLQLNMKYAHLHRVNDIVQQNLQLIKQQRIVAIKQAILDYVLKNPFERERLNIFIPPLLVSFISFYYLLLLLLFIFFFFVCKVRIKGAPLKKKTSKWICNESHPWHKAIDEQWHMFATYSYFISKSAVVMLPLFENALSRTELFDTSCDSPLSVKEFEEKQETFMEKGRSQVMNDYYKEACSYWKRYVEEHTYFENDSEMATQLFNCVSALMCQQLTSVVYHSLHKMKMYFLEKFNAIRTFALSSQSCCCWKVTLQWGPNGFDYDVPLHYLTVLVDRFIHALLSSFQGLVRIEAKIFPRLKNVPMLKYFSHLSFKKKKNL
ncbi:hypothetical protein RFI_18634, partial [Reticulomyxa filosa]